MEGGRNLTDWLTEPQFLCLFQFKCNLSKNLSGFVCIIANWYIWINEYSTYMTIHWWTNSTLSFWLPCHIKPLLELAAHVNFWDWLFQNLQTKSELFVILCTSDMWSLLSSVGDQYCPIWKCLFRARVGEGDSEIFWQWNFLSVREIFFHIYFLICKSRGEISLDHFFCKN